MNDDKCFDRVEIEQDDGTVQTLTPSEFVKLPMLERIRYLLASRANFFKGADPVAASTAMKALREARNET